jgi:hypothetical protein
MPYAELVHDWRGRLSVNYQSGNSFLLKRKGAFKSGYVLFDKSETEIASIDAKFEWKTFGLSYTIIVSDEKLSKDDSEILPFLLLYCIKAMQARHAAVH